MVKSGSVQFNYNKLHIGIPIEAITTLPTFVDELIVIQTLSVQIWFKAFTSIDDNSLIYMVKEVAINKKI